MRFIRRARLTRAGRDSPAVGALRGTQLAYADRGRTDRRWGASQLLMTSGRSRIRVRDHTRGGICV